ncbi:hypothetical protein E2C01_087644 [Portunus trituberculatus]|uniref:Uncharacterized protein n=1 Tax=Portunus trituberculatus TaxID=210409 RepID=A0A5B7JC86_PORTR|nr:hypothetical protein [Portunus trituberculatus]
MLLLKHSSQTQTRTNTLFNIPPASCLANDSTCLSLYTRLSCFPRFVIVKGVLAGRQHTNIDPLQAKGRMPRVRAAGRERNKCSGEISGWKLSWPIMS